MFRIAVVSLCLAFFSVTAKAQTTSYLPMVLTAESKLYYTALAGYEPTYWHNELIIFDEAGIPTVYYGKDIGYQYNPVTVSQYALSLYNAYLDTKDAESLKLFWAQVHYLQTHYKPIGEDGAAFTYEFPLSSYNLPAG